MSWCPMLRILPASTETRRTARHRSRLAQAAGAPTVVASLLAFATGTASAVVLDMEGLAPPGGETNELVTNPPGFGVSTQGDFTLTVEHGHYWSSSNSYLPAQSDLGGTASDWFLHDHDGPLTIAHAGGASFGIIQFEAGEWLGQPTPSTTGNEILVVGTLTVGGTITTTFVTDDTPSDGTGPNVDFEVFTFPAGWDDLVSISFQTNPPNDDALQMGYDNVVLEIATPSACTCDGDQNGDGLVTHADELVVLDCLGAAPALPTDPCHAADVDCDGDVDTADSAILACQLGAPPDALCCDCADALVSVEPTPTFSAEAHGVTVQTNVPTWPTYYEYMNGGAQILTSAIGGIPGPNPMSPTDTTLTPGITRYQTELGLMEIADLDIDALSYGRDVALVCGGLGATLQFSVDEHAIGSPGGLVASLDGIGAQEVATDVLDYLGALQATPPGPPIGASLDVDGSRLGLVEPSHPPSLVFGDDLDAWDRETTRLDLASRIYFSMDAAGVDPLRTYLGGAAIEGFSGADVLVSEAGLVSIAVAAATLGLDLGGADTDDLDALAFHDADQTGDFSAGDTLLFSVRRGSAVIGTADSLLGLPIEPGDVLTVPTGPALPPAIYVPAERLGLRTTRTDAVAHGDDLDALDAALVPEPTLGVGLPTGVVALMLAATRRRAGDRRGGLTSQRDAVNHGGARVVHRI